MGRIVGVIMIVAGLAICAVVSLVLGVWSFGGSEGTGLSNSGAILGVALFGFVPLVILGGIGAYLFVQGGREAAEMADVQKKERLLGMIQAQGKVQIANAAVELKMTRQEVQNAIYDLVNQGLFAGYIDWKEGTFFSKDISLVQTTKCPNCGGIREVVGKGIVKCPYCGVELFLPQT